jgi:hypothetical protein
VRERSTSTAQAGANFTWPRLVDLEMPLFEKPLNYFTHLFFCCLLVFLFILGPHMGSYLNYAYQLLVPSFFLWLLTKKPFHGTLKLVASMVMLFNLLVWQQGLLNPLMLEQRDSQEWARVFEYLRASSATLNSPPVASEMILLDQMPVDSGQTAYFYTVRPFADTLLTGSTYQDFHEDGVRYMLLIERRIEKQKFDLVITTLEKANFYHDGLLSKYYSQVDQILVNMPQTGQSWTLVFWKPRVK